MRSRLAITTLLAAGLLMSGVGASLGASALLNGGSASIAQYGPGGGGPGGGGPGGGGPGGGGGGGGQVGGGQDVLGGGETGGDVDTGTTEDQGRAGEVAESAPSGVQAGRQIAGGGRNLPFTGYAAIPLLLVGIALLGTGLVLRRRAGAQS